MKCYNFKNLLIFFIVLSLSSISCRPSQKDRIQAADSAVANISHIPDIRIDSMVVIVTSLWDNSEIANIKIEPDSTVWSYVEYLPPYNSVKRTRTVRLDDSVGDRIVKLVEDMFIKKTVPIELKKFDPYILDSEPLYALVKIKIFEGGAFKEYQHDVSQYKSGKQVEYSDAMKELYHYVTSYHLEFNE